MSLALALLSGGIALMLAGTVVMLAAGWRGVGLERHPSALLDPEWNAKATRRAILVARVAFHVAAFGLGLLIAAGVAAVFEAIAAAT